MCGLAGFLDVDHRHRRDDMLDRVTAMTRTLAHRGPDDEGTWVDPAAGVALGSRRLAIIDVSPDGHQPMRSASGRYAIAYNGEVYNSQAMARDLEAEGRAPAWRGSNPLAAHGLAALWTLAGRTTCAATQRIQVAW